MPRLPTVDQVAARCGRRKFCERWIFVSKLPISMLVFCWKQGQKWKEAAATLHNINNSNITFINQRYSLNSLEEYAFQPNFPSWSEDQQTIVRVVVNKVETNCSQVPLFAFSVSTHISFQGHHRRENTG